MIFFIFSLASVFLGRSYFATLLFAGVPFSGLLCTVGCMDLGWWGVCWLFLPLLTIFTGVRRGGLSGWLSLAGLRSIALFME